MVHTWFGANGFYALSTNVVTFNSSAFPSMTSYAFKLLTGMVLYLCLTHWVVSESLGRSACERGTYGAGERTREGPDWPKKEMCRMFYSLDELNLIGSVP